mgnify:CR=1 FL=1
MANGGIIGPTNDPISLTVSAPGTAVNFTSSGTLVAVVQEDLETAEHLLLVFLLLLRHLRVHILLMI